MHANWCFQSKCSNISAEGLHFSAFHYPRRACAERVTAVRVTSWNCRGWSAGASYLEHMVHEGSDVVVLSEHWLWPYDLYKLDEFNPDYRGLGKADPRLTKTSDNCSRGCGGVGKGILWRRSFDVTPISDIQSDRICGIRVKRTTDDDQTWISILGVYLPCLDLGVELYRDSLVELERVVLESQQWGPVFVAGDFNAHLGPMWGPRAYKSPNVQGVLLGEVLDRCKLHAASLAEAASGPNYTYLSGNSKTIVDYILADVEASSCIESCEVLESSDLNTSDHLALSVSLLRHTNSIRKQSQLDKNQLGRGRKIRGHAQFPERSI